jgi:hypothetical protein
MKIKNSLLLVPLALVAMNTHLQAAVVFSGTAQSTPFTVDATTPLQIVNADLNYNSGENNSVPGGPNYWNILDNGSGGNTGKDGATVISSSAANHLTWRFANGPSSVASISVYSGWADNGRMEQFYSVYSTTDITVDGNSAWTLLTTVQGANGSPTSFGDATNNQLRVTIFDNASPTLLSNVTGLRFVFGAQQNGGVGYKEIDVQLVPETSTTLLGALSALALLRRRRC